MKQDGSISKYTQFIRSSIHLWRTRMTPQIPAPNCKPFSMKHIKNDIKAN